MKKILLYSLTVFLIQSCTVLKTKSNCSQDIKDLINYEDTIQIEFVGVDSSIFKDKNYKIVADSLFWNQINNYGKYDVMDLNTQSIHRIIYPRKKFDSELPFDTLKYKWVK